jgi:hypothetical protein
MAGLNLHWGSGSTPCMNLDLRFEPEPQTIYLYNLHYCCQSVEKYYVSMRNSCHGLGHIVVQRDWGTRGNSDSGSDLDGWGSMSVVVAAAYQ